MCAKAYRLAFADISIRANLKKQISQKRAGGEGIALVMEGVFRDWRRGPSIQIVFGVFLERHVDDLGGYEQLHLIAHHLPKARKGIAGDMFRRIPEF